jgi:hypothetical protein
MIRLRGPWECERAGAGGARFTRRFNQPTNLEAHERVWLVFERVGQAAWAMLNGQPLAQLDPTSESNRVEITPVLAPHNVLAIETAGPVDASGGRGLPETLVGEVRLEIAAD